ncbi:subtilisin-like serine protease [Legionella beliardensis]|uniref:Subtilisin-like serine protease n=1 Tax=Legionella beliardensis TaxID=91822 RepID=A0A378I1J6_9GAMM|nr:S8 family serine peptidase [Legionella beliardensis]STX28822.1 subtilisin-like serine protease [Legionella beliardensis]
MKKILPGVLLVLFSPFAGAEALIDSDVINNIKQKQRQAIQQTNSSNESKISLLIFLHSLNEKPSFLEELRKYPGLAIQEINFMPAVTITMPANLHLLNKLANHSAVAQISANNLGKTELDISTQILKLRPSKTYPEVKNWWDHGYIGCKGVIGLIDDGLDPTHPALANKTLIVRKEGGSLYSNFLNGVRSPHGTGVACIYASNNKNYKGIAYGAKKFVLGLSGKETPNIEDIMLTMSTLDWMLTRAKLKPTVINYSMGNGKTACPNCPEWSGLAKVIDYVVNHEKILWVKSAGNAGYIAPTNQAPFASTLTVPGDNYNALTVANMNPIVTENGIAYKTENRDKHSIRSTSSRGPTTSGRRKPDLTAPGHSTRTCAPDPETYPFKYTDSMDYKSGYRLMTGTSAAAPHVGAAILLIQDAGITNPLAIKALLINSADTWTDNGNEEPYSGDIKNHFPIRGSQWNRTYGWGYLNMEEAFEQRKNIIEDKVTLEHSSLTYDTFLEVGDKVTLVHERRVGYFKDNTEWQLSHLSLELIDKETGEVIAYDDSPIDTVHQVANCKLLSDGKCSLTDKPRHVLVQVKLVRPIIDGSDNEPFALVLKAIK